MKKLSAVVVGVTRIAAAPRIGMLAAIVATVATVATVALAAIGAIVATGSVLSANEPGAQSPQRSSTEVCTLKISGMTCAGCEAAVRIAARSVDGVRDAKVSYARGEAEITFDPGRTNPEAIARAITEKSGFKATPVRTPRTKTGG